MQGNTALKNSYNIKDINTFPMTFFGGWVHDAQGNKGNGFNTYGKFGFSPNTELDDNNCALMISSLSNTTIADIFMLASANNNNRMILSTRFRGNNYCRIGEATYFQDTVTDATGVLSVSNTGGNMQIRRDGIIIGTVPSAAYLPSAETYYGAYNNSGSILFYADNYLGSFSMCTADVEPIISEALIMWEEGLGRKAI